MKQEKTQKKTFTILPNVFKKAQKISKELFGKVSFSKLITFLIIEKYNEMFKK